ncbi:MAG: type II toxin-antitoxin system RelE/ParE family toxin [Gammaproteobacteria bacterium]
MRIHWQRLAIADLQKVRRYIERDNPHAARAVVLRILDAVELLALTPGLGRPGRVPGTRELVVNDTPYIVPYRVRNNEVDVLRVYHHARSWPGLL